MKYHRDIYLSILGKINNTNGWSGTGFFSLKAIQKKYTNVYGIDFATSFYSKNLYFKLNLYS